MKTKRIRVEIEAKVTAHIDVPIAETQKQTEKRWVDIYLHNPNSMDKLDLGTDRYTVKVIPEKKRLTVVT